MYRIKTSKSVDEAIAALQGGVEAAGMRVVTHINGQANAAKIGKEVPADQILEIFRPDFAIRVWSACKEAGIDIPLRIYAFENSDGKAVIMCRMPKEVFAPYESPELMSVAEELEGIFSEILAAVPGE